MPAAATHRQTAATGPAPRRRTINRRSGGAVARLLAQTARAPGLPDMVRAAGARQWCADGREYVDFHNGGGAVLLGHDDPDVAEGVRRAQGVSPHRLGAELVERLVDLSPHAETAVFTTSYADALDNAILSARIYTGRPLVFACDSCLWRETAGLPAFAFNDLTALERTFNDYAPSMAAVILAPLSHSPPSPGYLAGVQRLAARHGVLLILDEGLSGFRVHSGGAQALFGMRADLAVFGESLANGRPFGAIVGRGDPLGAAAALASIYAVETAALAAAVAVLNKVVDHEVPGALSVLGAEVQAELSMRIEAAGAAHLIKVVGDPSASSLVFSGEDGLDPSAMKAFWAQQTAEAGLISFAAQTMSFAHTEADVAVLVETGGHIAERLVAAVSGDRSSLSTMVQ